MIPSPISSCISPAFYFQGDLNQLLPWLRCQPLWGRGSVSTWAQLIWHHGARLANSLPCGRGLDLFSISVTSYCFITSIEDHKHCLKDLPDKNLCCLPWSCLKFYFQVQLRIKPKQSCRSYQHLTRADDQTTCCCASTYVEKWSSLLSSQPLSLLSRQESVELMQILTEISTSYSYSCKDT